MLFRSLLPLLLLAPLGAFAQPDPFFTADPSAHTRLAPQQADVLHHLEALDAFVATELGRLDPAALTGDDDVALRLPGGSTVLLRPDRVERRGATDFSWFGSGTTRGTIGTFVVQGETVVGTVRHADRLYTLRPLGNGLYALVRLDEDSFQDHPSEWDAIEEAAASVAPSPVLGQDATIQGGDPVITLIVPYTARAASEVGGVSAVEALIQLAEDETNQSYLNSNVNVSVEVVHTYQVSGAETNNLFTDLDRFRNNGDGDWDNVHTLRDTYAADVAIMITGNAYGGYCGVASAIYASESSAFALATNSCATGYYTFGHELGHLQGARHNPETDGSTSPFPYGHGKYYQPARWRTVMSYNCSGGCTRIPYWSNPNVTYGGVSMGDTSTRHNARVLSETAATLASFRNPAVTPVASVVATPTGSTTVGSTGGPLLFDLSFSNTSGADFTGVYWVLATLPNGNPFGPVFGPTALNLADGATVTESLIGNVPPRAPAGGYTVTAYVGPSYPDEIDDTSSFAFTKSASVTGPDDAAVRSSAEAVTWHMDNLARGLSTETVMPDAQVGASEVFALETYPSPLVGRATAAFTLPVEADVRLEVYDVLGRRLVVVAEGAYDTGRHEVTLTSAGLPSGVYVLRLQAAHAAGVRTTTQRITVVR